MNLKTKSFFFFLISFSSLLLQSRLKAQEVEITAAALQQSQAGGSAALPQSKLEVEDEAAITAADYCTFLNAATATDTQNLYDELTQKMEDGRWKIGVGTPSILAVGVPGSFSYSVIRGKEDNPMTGISWFDATQYCNWKNNASLNSEGSTPIFYLPSSISCVSCASNIDASLKSNQLTFQVVNLTAASNLAAPSSGGAGKDTSWEEKMAEEVALGLGVFLGGSEERSAEGTGEATVSENISEATAGKDEVREETSTGLNERGTGKSGAEELSIQIIPLSELENCAMITINKLKYPLLRVEQILTPQGSVVRQSEMAASHLLVTLEEKMSPETFLEILNRPEARLEAIPWTPRLYRLHFRESSSCISTVDAILLLHKMPEILEEITRKFPTAFPEPDLLYRGYNGPNHTTEEAFFSQEGLTSIASEPRKESAPAPKKSGGFFNTATSLFNRLPEGTQTQHALSHWNSIDNNTDSTDDHGYGTSSALRVVGDAAAAGRGVQLLSCKWLNARREGFYSDAISCLYYGADHGVSVFQCHWSFPNMEDRIMLRRAFQYAQSKGIQIAHLGMKIAFDGNEIRIVPIEAKKSSAKEDVGSGI